MLKRGTQVLSTGTFGRGRTVQFGGLLVHVGHDLGGQVEAIDDLILPLIYQHSVLEANRHLRAITILCAKCNTEEGKKKTRRADAQVIFFYIYQDFSAVIACA